MWKGIFQKVSGEDFRVIGRALPSLTLNCFLLTDYRMGLSRTECVARRSFVEHPIADSHAGRNSKTCKV